MARKKIDASELGEVANDLREMEDEIARLYEGYVDIIADKVMESVEDTVPEQDSEDDTKPDQLALSETFKKETVGTYHTRVISRADHAALQEKGTSGGWTIPNSGFVAFKPENGKQWIDDDADVTFDEETGRVVVPSVTAGSYTGHHYASRALWNVKPGFDKTFHEPSEKAIINSGFTLSE